MRLKIIHGGQTGVDRGAHYGATDSGLEVGGTMPKDRTDELGVIPSPVASCLSRCPTSGLVARTDANVDSSHAVLVIVADKMSPYATPGTHHTLTEARLRKRPRMVVDPVDPHRIITEWLTHLMAARAALPGSPDLFKLMVAGPRASRWSNGEAMARAIVSEIGRNTLINPKRYVERFWLQPTRSFAEGAPQREDYGDDRMFERACVSYANEWRDAYICHGCRDVNCPQCGAEGVRP